MIQLSHKAYWEEIQALIEQVMEEAAERQEMPADILWELIDSHEWVIYTHQAQSILPHTRNENYVVEEWGDDGIVKDGSINWSLIAFGAMYGDCLETGTVDWNEIPAKKEESNEQ